MAHPAGHPGPGRPPPAASPPAAPGLVGFLALRSLAGNDSQWDEEPRCQILMVARLRQHLRRLPGGSACFSPC
jgi:hypothetical protein